MPKHPAKPDSLAGRIHTIRGQRVILDSDLARLYGVPTFRFNEAVKRNAAKFPKDFRFQLTREEFAVLNRNPRYQARTSLVMKRLGVSHRNLR